jgi:hypothetical protein
VIPIASVGTAELFGNRLLAVAIVMAITARGDDRR